MGVRLLVLTLVSVMVLVVSVPAMAQGNTDLINGIPPANGVT